MSINNVSMVSDALKYVNGMEVKPQETNIVNDVKESVFNPFSILFGGVEVSGALKDTFQVSKLKELPSAIKATGTVEMGETIAGKALRSTKLSEQLSAAYKQTETLANAKAAKKAAKAAESAGKTGVFASIKNAFSTAKNAVTGAAKSAATAIGKTAPGSAVKSVLTKFGQTTAGTALKSAGSKVGTMIKGTGAVGMMAIEGVLGFVTEVIPAFQMGGIDSGVKQLGKTAVKTAGSGLGWAAGSTVGTAIGSAIGSIFPGVGTVIGGAVGKFLGGIIGSVVGGGIGKKIAGQSEVEKLQNEQFETAAAQVTQDNAAMSELNTLVLQQVQTEIANGTADEDTELMAQYINQGAFNTNGYATTPFTSATVQPATTATNTTANTPTNVPNQQTNYNYWNEVAQKAAQGDTSIYNISDERLQELFNTPSNQSATTQSTNGLNTTEDSGTVNYFATA